MKTAFLALTLVSFSALAGITEIECEGKIANKEIEVQIEQIAPYGSSFQKAIVSVTENNKTTEYSSNLVLARKLMSAKQIRYNAMTGVELEAMLALELEVNLASDNAPSWGRNYRSTFRFHKINDYAPIKVECSFPNAY